MLQDVVLSDAMEAELVDGRSYRKVSPKRKHGAVQLTLGAILRRCCGNRGKVASEWRCVLESGIDELIPDVAFFAYERLLPLSEEDREEPPFAPDVAIEVRSPSDTLAFLRRKTDLYLGHGCALSLDVDPETRTIVASDLEGNRQFGSGERFSRKSVPWLVFDVAEAFEDLDMPSDK